jgi:SAM-dependent methyltransferase
VGLYVQYGCGPSSCPEGWVNFDASPTLRLQKIPIIGRIIRRGPIIFDKDVRYGDIVRGLPIPNSCADGVYASHVLEHLTLEDFWIAIENTRRVLKPGGVFRLVVPDLEGRSRKYLKRLDDGDTNANAFFMASSHLGIRNRPRGGGRLRAAFGNSAHLWMWDEPSMRAALTSANFSDIRRARFGDSADLAFSKVETQGRFVDDGDYGGDECAMEARRPLSD